MSSSRDVTDCFHSQPRISQLTGMRTGFFSKKRNSCQKRGNPLYPPPPFKMQQICTYWVKPETIDFSKYWSKKRKSSKKRKILIPELTFTLEWNVTVVHKTFQNEVVISITGWTKNSACLHSYFITKFIIFARGESISNYISYIPKYPSAVNVF